MVNLEVGQSERPTARMKQELLCKPEGAFGTSDGPTRSFINVPVTLSGAVVPTIHLRKKERRLVTALIF